MTGKRLTTLTIAAACGVAASAVPSPAPAAASERVKVCADRLDVHLRPNAGWDGTLRKGESVKVRRLSDSGRYAYGLALGHINRTGWVRSSGLCSTSGVSGADRGEGGDARRRLVGSRVEVCAKQATVGRRPNAGWQGTLRRGESMRVRRLSDSGRYAYGLVFGHVNRTGWVRTGDLC